MNNGVRVISTNEEFKIFADPFRMKIIDTYSEQDKPLTVKMVADLLHEVPARVHYHIQKLIKIEILFLDHIQVINGINAKYYLLKDSSFKIDIIKDSSPKMKSFQVDATITMLLKTIDMFKTDIIKRGETVKNNPKKEDKARDGFLSKKNIYLSDEDLEVLRKMVFNYIQSHSKVDNTKTKYSMLAGIFQKED